MKKEMVLSKLFALAFFMSILMSGTASAAVSATLDKIMYVWGDDMAVSGTISGSSSASAVNATIYNATSSITSFSSTSSGGSPNTFSLSNAITSNYSSGDYKVVLSSGSDSVNISFKVIPQALSFESYMVNSQDKIINITTSIVIDSSGAGAFAGNFSELVGLSKSGSVHYGNYTITGKLYHFVLVDQTNTSDYDRLYIDDDTNFALYNDSEDIAAQPDVEYQALKKSSMFSNSTFRYVVGEMERATGNKVILWEPASGKTTYSTNDNITFIVLAENSTNMVSEPVKVEVFNSSGQNVTATYTGSSQVGWFNVSIPSGLPAGTYTIKLNDSMDSLSFTVESFKMFASISDTSNNPAYSFSPNSNVRLTLTAKNSSGPMNLTSFNATFYYPNGSTLSKGKTDFTQAADGIYTYDYSSIADTGRYSVSITGSDGVNAQTTTTGFEVQSVGLNAMAVNLRYIEDAESGGADVNAFSPASNVTIMTFLSNITAGGMTAKGAEGMMTGLVTPGNCNTSVTLLVKDENGDAYPVDYRAMNLSAAMAYLGGGPGGDGPPQQMLTQCMVIFAAPNKTGTTFKAEVKMVYGSEELYAGDIFGIQRLFARGDTVDFKGDDFAFLAPNSTTRIKLKVTDLVTDLELSARNITSAKIIELYKVFPSYKDVLGNSTLRSTLNASISNGTLVFNSPVDEGAYSMKFRFIADVGGATETGIGNAFFMLKKYMVWGQLYGAQQGQWFVRQGQNITLEVTVMNINDAQTVLGGQKSQKTCTVDEGRTCAGFVANVSQIRNDQQFKTITDYTVQVGTIINSTNPVANVTIIPGQGMQSGWYSVDISVTDPITNATYFGWGGFEIRNFWVDMQRAYWNASSHNVSGYSFIEMGGGGMGGETYSVDSPVEFVVLPREPQNFNPEPLVPTSVPVVESVMSSASWPPVPISGYSASVGYKNVTVCRVMGAGPVCYFNISAYVVNLTGLPAGKQASYMANVRINISGKTDIGTLRFSASSYQVNTDYRRDSFPPLFATSENLTINFTGTTLAVGNEKAGSHNLTNVTIDELFSPKLGRPIKMKFGQNYTTRCDVADSVRSCRTDVNLSRLPSGEYNARFAVVDSPSAEPKIVEIFFKVQGTIITIPSIEEAWVWQSDTVSKKIENDVRRAEWSQCNGDRYTMIPGVSSFCGDYQNCGQGGCNQGQFNLTVQNVTSSKEIFGYVSMAGDQTWLFGNSVSGARMCMYANGTHLWANSTFNSTSKLCNLTGTLPIAINGNFTDGNGGNWRLDAIGDQSITLTGLNTMYATGVLINTSYSKSGVIKFGQIWENNLGAFYKGDGGSGGRKGIDLNGDGYTNGTVYIAISDNAVSGVYDTVFFSVNNNFTGEASSGVFNPLSVSEINRTKREMGNTASKNRLTLLSIDPRGQRVLFYSKQMGDWAHLGDIKWVNNITIPVLVTSPAGTEETALVSVTAFKNTRTWKLTQTTLVSGWNITGAGELRINSSDLGATGDYAFGIETASGDKLEEWKWPMATVRGFLVDGEVGEALYINNFKRLPLQWKNWDSGITRIQSDRRNGSFIVDGVLSNAGMIGNPTASGCAVFNQTGNITDTVMPALDVFGFMSDNSPDGAGFFFYNSTDSKLYRNATDCWFNVSVGPGTSPSYLKGGSLILRKQGRNYNMTVLQVDRNDYSGGGCVSQGCWRADFGVAGVNSSAILPMLNNPFGTPNWTIEWGYMQNVSIFNSYYDVILANDTINYARCTFETSPDGQCAKKAWIVPRIVGNFSAPQAKNVTFGQNFTSDLYLASVGPRDGEGIIVGNFSNLTQFGLASLPAIGGLPLADGTPTYFSVLNETALNYDLDKNGSKDTIFYALAFDSDFNGVNALTHLLIDDDLQLMPWSVRQQGQPEVNVDVDNTEYYNVNASLNRTSEQWMNLPSGTSDGEAMFGADYNNAQFENQPRWNVPFYNNTHMLMKKSKWRVTSSQSVDVVIKAFDFSHNALSGANTTVSLARSTFGGFQRLREGDDYYVNKTYTETDSYGYNVLKIIPKTEWSNAQYQVLAEVQTTLGNETFERWFNVGGGFGGP